MSANKRATNEQVIEAYKATGSVWKAAKKLGIVGQSVWERLQRLGVKLPSSAWTNDELAELQRLAETCTIAEIAQRLGRPYYGVAIKLSRLGLAKRFGNRIKKAKVVPGALSKTVALKYAAQPPSHRGSLRAFAKGQGVSLGALVYGLQQHAPDVLRSLATERGLAEKACPNCRNPFIPLTKKQACCTTRCSTALAKDKSYFGGKRGTTVGLEEGVCQVCFRKGIKGLSSHHVFGKQNDPQNDALIAVCPGCHSMVGRLASMLDLVDNTTSWEALIALALQRRHGAARRPGIEVTVEWDWLTEEDLRDLADGGYL